ncbi:unnamed protein product, partial [marine sediment metagenome]
WMDIHKLIPGIKIMKISDEAIEFIDKNELSHCVNITRKVIERSFSNVHGINIELVSDPETNDSWIVFVTTLEGDINQILEEYQEYTAKIVKKIPYPKLTLIRFEHNIIE